MSDKSVLIRIKAIVEACEESKKDTIPTFYDTAEAVAYEHIRDLVKGEPNDRL